jgi:hypothetical protein
MAAHPDGDGLSGIWVRFADLPRRFRALTRLGTDDGLDGLPPPDAHPHAVNAASTKTSAALRPPGGRGVLPTSQPLEVGPIQTDGE